MGFRCAYVLYYYTEPAQCCYTVVVVERGGGETVGKAKKRPGKERVERNCLR